MLSARIEYKGAGLPSALTSSAHTDWRQVPTVFGFRKKKDARSEMYFFYIADCEGKPTDIQTWRKAHWHGDNEGKPTDIQTWKKDHWHGDNEGKPTDIQTWRKDHWHTDMKERPLTYKQWRKAHWHTDMNERPLTYRDTTTTLVLKPHRPNTHL